MGVSLFPLILFEFFPFCKFQNVLVILHAICVKFPSRCAPNVPRIPPMFQRINDPLGTKKSIDGTTQLQRTIIFCRRKAKLSFATAGFLHISS